MDKNKQIHEEKSEKQPSFFTSKRSYPKHLKSTRKMSIFELKNHIRGPDHFIWLFGVEMRYHLPPRNYVTWPYIIQVLQKNKELLKTDSIKLSSPIPKIKELNMKNIWPIFCEDQMILRHMPILNDNKLPPRTYFFEILSTLKPKQFENLMENVQKMRSKREQDNNRILFVDSSIFEEMKKSTVWNEIGSKKQSKRILTRPVKRRFGNSGNILKSVKE